MLRLSFDCLQKHRCFSPFPRGMILPSEIPETRFMVRLYWKGIRYSYIYYVSGMDSLGGAWAGVRSARTPSPLEVHARSYRAHQICGKTPLHPQIFRLDPRL